MAEDASSVIKLMKDNDCDTLDIKFIDVPGTWQHVALPTSEVNDDLFTKGTGFDGSSVRGFQSIDESDMLLLPHAETAAVDPFQEKTITIIADIRNPLSESNYSRDPRYVTIKAEQHLSSSGVGDVSYWGPELEFFVFDSVRFFQTENEGYFKVDSDEGIWNSGAEYMIDGQTPNIGQRPGYKGGYFPAAPIDTHHDMRSEMVRIMVEVFGMEVEKHHHEVATAGQGEIDLRYDSLLSMTDKVMQYKYVVKNVAQSWGKVATFMPKPLFNDNGTGMHVHQSIWKNGKPLFAGKEYGGLSKLALNYIGGLIKHGNSLMGLCAPTSNSYKRLVPGFEAPTILSLSARNRSAACRVPMYFQDPKTKRVEFRPPDGTCNPYLAFPAMLMAGLDGIENGYDPGEPLEGDLFEMSDEEAKKLKQVPGSIEEALNALEEDHDYLLKGDVFTEDILEAWISHKRETEVDEIRTRPHPWEYYLTFNA